MAVVISLKLVYTPVDDTVTATHKSQVTSHKACETLCTLIANQSLHAQAFAKHYTTVNRNNAVLIQKKVNTLFDTVFSKDIPEIAKSAASRLRMLLGEHPKHAEMDCVEAIKAMEAHNTLPYLIFSPNEHYLNDLIQKMVARGPNRQVVKLCSPYPRLFFLKSSEWIPAFF